MPMTNMFYFGHTYTWLYSLVGHKLRRVASNNVSGTKTLSIMETFSEKLECGLEVYCLQCLQYSVRKTTFFTTQSKM